MLPWKWPAVKEHFPGKMRCVRGIRSSSLLRSCAVKGPRFDRGSLALRQSISQKLALARGKRRARLLACTSLSVSVTYHLISSLAQAWIDLLRWRTVRGQSGHMINNSSSAHLTWFKQQLDLRALDAMLENWHFRGFGVIQQLQALDLKRQLFWHCSVFPESVLSGI